MLNQVATNQTEVATMSSREIAALTGKNHADVMRDIRAMVSQVGCSLFAVESVDYRVDGQTRKYPEYLLPRREYEILMQKYEFGCRAHGAREHGALCAIEQLLGIKLMRQFIVGKYRIDGYCIETHTAYEIDEEQHRTVSAIDSDRARQSFIENELGCSFVRIAV